MNIAQIALENKAWDDAIAIYEFVIKTFQEGSNYALAKRFLLKSKEERIKSVFPVTTAEIESLVADYKRIVEEIGINNISLEALLSKARLQAFYLNQKDSAIQVLLFIINNKKSSPSLIASSKLELGDIFLLSGEPWESSLLYSQVEKANKDSPIAYEAKLRNARLSYFIGDFALAKSHLDILKLATTREIANDALFLSVQIQNNTAFDSTDYIMKQYAAIELLIFQNRYEEAELAFNQMLKDFPNHSLVDEIHWNLSKIELARGNFELALSHLEFIVKQYGYDILNDDAMFKTGEILANNLHRPDQAVQVFIQFLKEHPGSSYASEARAYVRQLRGDLPN
jgi:TolA-binding protein